MNVMSSVQSLSQGTGSSEAPLLSEPSPKRPCLQKVDGFTSPMLYHKVEVVDARPAGFFLTLLPPHTGRPPIAKFGTPPRPFGFLQKYFGAMNVYFNQGGRYPCFGLGRGGPYSCPRFSFARAGTPFGYPSPCLGSAPFPLQWYRAEPVLLYSRSSPCHDGPGSTSPFGAYSQSALGFHPTVWLFSENTFSPFFYLASCGDVHPNPGPGTPTNGSQMSMDQTEPDTDVVAPPLIPTPGPLVPVNYPAPFPPPDLADGGALYTCPFSR